MESKFLSMLAMVDCSREEKKKVIPLIVWIEKALQKARFEGLLSLEDELDVVPTRFLRDLVELVVDGTDPVEIERYAWIRIHSQKLAGIELLSALIALEGILSIQEGTLPYLLKRKLLAYLGRDRDLYRQMLQQAESENLDNIVKKEIIDNKIIIEKIDKILKNEKENNIIEGDPSAVLSLVLKRKPLTLEQRVQCGKLLTLEQVLEELEPEKLALLFLAAEPKDLSEVISRLSPEKLYAVFQEIEAYRNYKPREMMDACRRALERMVSLLEDMSWPCGGWPAIQTAVESMSTEACEKLITYLDTLCEKEDTHPSESSSPGFCKTLRGICLDTRFELEEWLQEMGDRDWARFLQELYRTEQGYTVIINYLYGQPDTIRNLFYRNMSERAAELLQQDLMESPYPSPTEVLHARRKIISVLRSLNNYR